MDGGKLILDAAEKALNGKERIRLPDQVCHPLLLLFFLFSAVDHLPVHRLRGRADQEQNRQDQHQEQRLEAPSEKPQQACGKKPCDQSQEDIRIGHVRKCPDQAEIDQRKYRDQRGPWEHQLPDCFLLAGACAEIPPQPEAVDLVFHVLDSKFGAAVIAAVQKILPCGLGPAVGTDDLARAGLARGKEGEMRHFTVLDAFDDLSALFDRP